MKRFSILCAVLLVVACATLALAAGRYPWTAGSATTAKEIPNMTGASPIRAQSGCVTLTTTKQPFGVYTSLNGYAAYEAEIVTSAGAATPARLALDGTNVAYGNTFKIVNSRGNTYAKAVMYPWSAASREVRACFRRW